MDPREVAIKAAIRDYNTYIILVWWSQLHTKNFSKFLVLCNIRGI